uniref:USP domain-containing protein n=1 Tax=Arcella intermedia TaxID=1963864 RepID=A0A6B2KX63_9EUKA
MGATCYMNSLLQQFFTIPSFKQGILEAVPANPLDEKEPQMLIELQRLFTFLQESEMKSYNLTEFAKTYKVDGRPISFTVQQDVDEFMNVMSSELETQLKGTPAVTIFKDHFGVVLANEIKSIEPEFPYFSETPEEFLRIPLEVKHNSDIYQALDVFVASDKLEGDNAYTCEKYNRKLNATKGYCIKELSNYLIFNLKRFEFDFTNNRRLKLNDYFSFPNRLNMKPWTQEGLREKNNQTVEESTVKRPDNYYEYELCGVLVHFGTSESGHYYSYIRQKRDDGSVNWYEFNDSTVQPFNINNLEKECFGGSEEGDVWDSSKNRTVHSVRPREKSAYMLFYQRVNPISTSKEPKKTEIPKPTLDRIKKVHKENAHFLQDRLFFDPSYFDFMISFARIIPTRPSEVSRIHLNIVYKYIMDILCRATEKTTLFHWIPLLRRIFSIMPVAAADFLTFVLLPFPRSSQRKLSVSFNTPLDSDENIMKQMLLECPHETTRVAVLDMITSALANVVPEEIPPRSNIWGRANETIDSPHDLINVSFSCQLINSWFTMVDASRFVWKKFKQYWELIRNFALMGFHPRNYLRSNGILKELKCYFVHQSRSGFRRPDIMDSEHFPDLRDLYEIMEIIICSCRTEREVSALAVDEDFYRTPYSFTGKLLPQLNIEERMEFFDREFFTSLIETDYNGPSMSRIVCHVSYECNARTQFVIYQLLSIAKFKIQLFVRQAGPLLSLQDSLTPKRIQWLLCPHKFTLQGMMHSSLGLLGLVKEEPHYTIYLIYVLLHFITKSRYSEHPQIYEYVKSKIFEVQMMKDHIQSELQSKKQPLPEPIDEGAYKEIEDKIQASLPRKNQYTITLEQLYLLICKFIDEVAMGTMAEWEKREKSHLHQIEILRSEYEKLRLETGQLEKQLRDVIEKSKHEPIVTETTGAIVPIGPVMDITPEADTRMSYPAPDEEMQIITITDGPEPADLPEKIKNLSELFPNLSDSIIRIALQSNHWDVDQTCLQLFDDSAVEQYKRQYKRKDRPEDTEPETNKHHRIATQ